MKLFIFIAALLNSSLLWAGNQINDELGRSVANYQVCSHIALDINDKQMFSYYQKMYNDAQLSIVGADELAAKQVYKTWESSEKILNGVGKSQLKALCLSRFAPLARKMLKK